MWRILRLDLNYRVKENENKGCYLKIDIKKRFRKKLREKIMMLDKMKIKEKGSFNIIEKKNVFIKKKFELILVKEKKRILVNVYCLNRLNLNGWGIKK